jgi:hypothetical protein
LVASKVNFLVSPGLIGANSSSTFTRAAWKSMEWEFLFVFSLVSVKSTVSPTVTRTTGPGTVPLKVHDSWVVPLLSMTVGTSLAVRFTCTVLASAPGASARTAAAHTAAAAVFIPA